MDYVKQKLAEAAPAELWFDSCQQDKVPWEILVLSEKKSFAGQSIWRCKP